MLFPVVVLFLTSFEVGTFGRETTFGLANWWQPFESPRLGAALWNTFTLSLARQAVALVVSIAIAWLIARSNLPGRSWLEVGFWIAMFMPALPVAMAWILLAGGRSGLLNIWLRDLLPFVDGPVFNIYSWAGSSGCTSSPPPSRSRCSCSSRRSATWTPRWRRARASGTGLFETVRRIVVPLMMPILIVTTLIGLIGAMQSFEIELILGTPASIDVYSTIIYSAMKQEPPLYGVASVLSIMFVGALLPFVLLQKWYSRSHTYGILGGRFSSRAQDLGAWRWPLFALVLALVLIMTVLPATMIVIGTFMKLFGAFNLPNPWTTEHWHDAFSQSELVRSLMNSLKLGFGAALAGMVVYSAIAYITVNRRFAGGHLLDFLTWMPTVIPGIVMSMGLLQMFLQVPVFRPLYGTIWALIFAVLIGGMTVGSQIVRGTLLQLSAELEEASLTSGASRLRTFFKIVLPLVAPSVIVAGLNVFGTAVSVVSLVVLLGTGPTQPLSILQLAYLDSGHFEPATIIGLLILCIAVTAAVLARIISARFSVAR